MQTNQAAEAAAQNTIPRWRGFNLLSFFQALSPSDRSSCELVEDDLRWMRDWGFDFVRLPMSYRCWSGPERWRELADTELIHLLTCGAAPYAREEMAAHFRVNSLFISENVRDVIQDGLGDYTPIFLSDIPRLFSSGQLPLDAALIQVTPPDEHGMCSLGVSVDIVKSAAETASLVVAQVNPNVPRTLGDAALQIFLAQDPRDLQLVGEVTLDANGVGGIAVAGDLLAVFEYHQRRNAADRVLRGDRLLVLRVQLCQPHTRFQHGGRLLE